MDRPKAQPDVLLEIKADALEVKPCGVEREAGDILSLFLFKVLFYGI